MREIIKISMDLDIDEVKGKVRLGIQQGIANDIEELLTKDEFKEVKKSLDDISEVISEAGKRDITETIEKQEEEEEEFKKEINDIDEKIQNCENLDDLLKLALKFLTEDK